MEKSRLVSPSYEGLLMKWLSREVRQSPVWHHSLDNRDPSDARQDFSCLYIQKSPGFWFDGFLTDPVTDFLKLENSEFFTFPIPSRWLEFLKKPFESGSCKKGWRKEWTEGDCASRAGVLRRAPKPEVPEYRRDCWKQAYSENSRQSEAKWRQDWLPVRCRGWLPEGSCLFCRMRQMQNPEEQMWPRT